MSVHMMDTSFLAHANSLLINYPAAVLPTKHYYFTYELNAEEPSYTFVIRATEESILPSKVTESGSRGIIIHFQDLITPRPFDREGGIVITFLSPLFEGYSIFEISPIHTIMVLRVKNTTMDLNFGYDTPILKVN